MKGLLGLILSLLIVNSTFGQIKESVQELCVINLYGAKVYKEPTFNSKILTELHVGEKIKIEKKINTYDSLKIGEGFLLKGFWIKPKTIDGFVFTSDFTEKNVGVEINESGQTFINLLGNLLDEKTEVKMIKTENGVFPKYYKYKYYENGTYTGTSWDPCFDHITKYKNLTLKEVYHQMVSEYSTEFNGIKSRELWIPKFREKTGNVIKFECEGASQDLQIEIMSGRIFEVSSYDCS